MFSQEPADIENTFHQMCYSAGCTERKGNQIVLSETSVVVKCGELNIPSIKCTLKQNLTYIHMHSMCIVYNHY